jgi:hypothetical protein
MRNNYIRLFVAIIMIQLFTNCVKDESNPYYREDIFIKSDFVINQIYNITDSSATIEGTFSSNYPRNDVKALGYTLAKSYCEEIYSDTISILNDTISIISDKKDGTIICNITGLESKTRYWVIPLAIFNKNIMCWGIPDMVSLLTH